MVAGGRSSLLHVWDLSSQCLVRAVQLPERVRVVKQLVFLAHSYDGGASQVQPTSSVMYNHAHARTRTRTHTHTHTHTHTLLVALCINEQGS